MRPLIVIFTLAALSVFVSANPVLIKVINEYQVAPENSELVEFKLFMTPATDTVFDPIDLYNASINTPAGTAVIDTHLILPGSGFLVIDSSDMNGPFDLPDSAGFFRIALSWRDSVIYPSPGPTPPSGSSAAFYHGYGYVPLEGYFFYGDWYVDASPTMGGPNDDYPGCVINGHVYDASAQPISGARVVVNTDPNILPRPPFYCSCTTYTAADGSYSIDSLLPFYFWVKVVGTSYYPDSHYTPQLSCRAATTVNFYLTGAAETTPNGAVAALTAAPNPFNTEVRFTIHDIRYMKKDFSLRVYNASGRLIKDLSSNFASCGMDYASWNGQTVPAGIYFARLETATSIEIKKIVKLE